MIYVGDDGPGPATTLPPAPPPPPVAAAPPAPYVPPAPPPAAANVNGESLAQAEAAAQQMVSNGASASDALAQHPLPPGTTTAEAMRFLQVLSNIQLSHTPGLDPAIANAIAAGGDPQVIAAQAAAAAAAAGGGGGGGGNAPADPSVDLSGPDTGRELESAYAKKPAGVAASWRDLVDFWKVSVPAHRASVHSGAQALKDVFK